ncbi:hypothetical protein I302_108618 [Kwoniella bestiolae CBS 10118]|uniref:Uncharacterized protein n=1 Tax=Kwoniella bestiolae CBS 10118 TaxID=1296100 RepID=A0AAJ8KG31_9TREE
MKGKKSKRASPPLEGFYQPYDPPGYIPQSGPPQHSQFVHPASIPALNGAPAALNPFTQPHSQNAHHTQSNPPLQYRLPDSVQLSTSSHHSIYPQSSSSTPSNPALNPYNPYAKHVYHPNPPYNQIGIRQYLEEETHFECAECDSRRKDDKRAAWCDKCAKFTRNIKINGP